MTADNPFEVPSTQLGDAPPAADARTMPAPRGVVRDKLAGELLARGETIDDFEILDVLGRGAFGIVYRARQLSLDREIALKVAANHGSEGRTMARLEHRYIVQVFSESVHTATNQRLLCMQLVPGVPLDFLINELKFIRQQGSEWNGVDLLAIVDQRSPHSSVFDASALRDRERLGRMDRVEATAWIGARLAEALDYAHQQGVTHRDIKPANVLINRYGQPLLADFNISFQSFDGESQAADSFGGTIAYMSPEHLAAYNPRDATPPDAVDGRSDLYSLGIVVGELLETQFPLPLPDRRQQSGLSRVSTMAESRREYTHPVPAGPANAAKSLHQVVSRSVLPDPSERFARGTEMMAALDGVVALRGFERDLPTSAWLARVVTKWPFASLIAAALIPQFVGSAFNIAYNTLEIAGRLSPPQVDAFWKVVGLYNAIVYPLVAIIGAWVLWKLNGHWQEIAATKPAFAGTGTAARRAALRVPRWLLLLVAIGWLPGGLIFPVAIDRLAGPLASEVYWHFFVSFALSGLIALAYSICAVQYVVLRSLYARMWPDATDFGAIARTELACQTWRLTTAQALAGSIPLVAAVLFLALQSADESRWFRLLAITLIVLGAFGYQLASHLTRRVAEIGQRMTLR